MYGTPGPRDWAPYEPERTISQAPRRAAQTCPPAQSSRGAGLASLLLGAASLVLAVLPIAATTSTTISYALSTIGVFAVIVGARAVRASQWRLAGWVGILTGTIATVLMVAQAINFHLVAGSSFTPMPYPVRPSAAEPAAQAPLAAASTPAVDWGLIVAGVQNAAREFLLSPAGSVTCFVVVTILLCVGAVTTLRWLGRSWRRMFLKRSAWQPPRRYNPLTRPSWERIDGTRVYED